MVYFVHHLQVLHLYFDIFHFRTLRGSYESLKNLDNLVHVCLKSDEALIKFRYPIIFHLSYLVRHLRYQV